MPSLLNWDLIRSPINWLTCILMVLIAAFAVDVLMRAKMELGKNGGYDED